MNGADPIRVVYIIDSLEPGGAERSLTEMAPELSRLGVEVTVATLRRSNTPLEASLRAAGVPLLAGDNLTAFRAVRRLRRLLRDLKPHIVHTTLFASDLWGRLASVRLPVVRVSSLVNTPGDPRAQQLLPGARWKRAVLGWVDRTLARHLTDAFHAITVAAKEDAVRRLGVAEHRIRVVYRGRSRHRLGYPSPQRRQQVRQGLGLSGEEPLVLTCARHDRQKGLPVLLRAASVLQQRGLRPRTWIAGKEGGDTEELRRLHQKLGLEDTVRFLGHREDVGDLLAAADLFVFPSLWEGLGCAVLEAMAMGLPVVASDLPAVREALPPGGGILVPPGDARALAEGIAALLTDRDRAAQMGRLNLQRFEETFTLERAVAGMAEFYRWALDTCRPRRRSPG